MNALPEYAVILAGGKGERFWPLSTSQHPKQVLRLFGNQPLLAHAVDSVAGLIPPERVLVITADSLVDVTRATLPALPVANVVGEPIGRDTAAATALAAALVGARDPKAAFCILTADHLIGDRACFQQTLRQSFSLAHTRDCLVTIGITPSFPSTGYGYIEAGDPVATIGNIAFFHARRFVEKPVEDVARGYLETGRFYWNSGMFVFSVAAVLRALERFQPHLAALAGRLQAVVGTSAFAPALAQEYSVIDRVSIDYAIMEKAENLLMARGTFPWDDVGAWPSLENHFAADHDGNVVLGRAATLDATGNIVVSQDRLTALLGVEDLVVVHGEHATLVCSKSRAQDVKQLVRLLGENADCRDLL